MRTPVFTPPDVPGALATFRRTFDREPGVTWLAPGRVNLIGEHTDYNDGFVLPLAIGAGCLAVAAGADDGTLEVASIQRPGSRRTRPVADLDPGTAHGWSAYAEGVVWAMRERGLDVSGGARILVDGNVPPGAGLSSSAALECAVAGAADRLFGLGLAGEDLVAVARQAENDYVGAPTGGMDQLISVLGRDGHVLLCDMRSLVTRPVPFDLAAHDLALLVVDSKAPHQLVSGEYGERRSSCERAAAMLGVPALRDIGVGDLDEALRLLAAGGEDADMLVKRARHVVTENERVLETVEALESCDFAAVGTAMTASHASMRDDFENSVPQVDVAVEIALDTGALGARMTGGGFGGCVIALVPADGVDAVADAVTAGFRERGWTPPVPSVARATDGARAAA